MSPVLYEQDLAALPWPIELRGLSSRPVVHCLVDLALPCNMRCLGCSPPRSAVPLSEEAASGVHEQIMRRAFSRAAGCAAVGFYGGEPLLALDLLARISALTRRACLHRGIAYRGFLLTNGTLLRAEETHKLDKAGVSRVQVTLEGPRRIHDRRRRLEDGRPSFRRIVENLKEARQSLWVVVHTNIGPEEAPAVADLVEALGSEGLFEPPRPVLVYVAGPVSYAEQMRALWKVTALQEALEPASPLSGAPGCC